MGSQTKHAPKVSVIVPSWSGDVGRLCNSLEQQTFQDYELIVVRGVSPGGLARNQGVARSAGELLLFVDDDAYLGHDRVLEAMVALLDADATISVAGPSKLIPPTASWLQRRIAAEIPRWVYPVLGQDTESNPPLDSYGFTGITTTCCLMRRSAFDDVGGFDPTLVKGQDTEFFYRVRRANHRFVIPANSWVYHDPPSDMRTLLLKSFRGGKSHAIEARRHPERGMDVVPLDRWYGKLFVLVSPLLFVPSIFVSYVFEPVRGLQFGFRPIKALSTLVTLYGYTYGWYSSEAEQRRKPQSALPL